MKVLELFAGAGGAALGLHAAGMQSVGLVEWHQDACATLRAAGMAPVIEGDVRDLDNIEAQITARPDVLWSSFPCQAWSNQGKRMGAQDKRNGWPWTVAALDRFQPRWFLGENVRGLISHRFECPGDPTLCPGCYFHGVILPDLRARFACVGYWLLDAADYGVPQHRQRVILWAGPRPVDKPRATHGDPAAISQRSMFGPELAPWVSMGGALGISATDCASIHTRLNRPADTLIGGSVDSHTCGRSIMRAQVARDAIEAATGRSALTVRQCALLQDFPPDHPFQGTKTSSFRQVGNAVPPTLARVAAQAIMKASGG